ncbi:hypothetical protein RGQ29_001566 [Quercus rubra]|uniref:Uncharacterized protein n=1 Tax=Quercus rubra TaxID=3512 RepID=A0AAN7G7G6_QUERU|nr:hypothetical protein RGQ29_001566 [Quercus rubra]
MQSYHYNRLMSKSSRCYSAAANRRQRENFKDFQQKVLIWLVVASRTEGSLLLTALVELYHCPRFFKIWVANHCGHSCWSCWS